jgi:hypothetical protein
VLNIAHQGGEAAPPAAENPGPSASFHRAPTRYRSPVVVIAVAQWVWIAVIFAAVLLGVAALARRA